jgi:uncharacterized protein YqgC (DUF456 family)
MIAFWWVVTLLLMLAGLIATVVPLVPGTVVILGAAVLHHFMAGPQHSVSWQTLVILTFFMVGAQVLDFISGSLGARRFGGSRLGAIGGIVGAVAGLFFGLPGIFIGPPAGVLLGELLGGRGILPAGRSTWGTVLGSTAGMLAKFFIGLVMIAWFLIAALR